MPKDQPITTKRRPCWYQYGMWALLIIGLLPVEAILWSLQLPKGYEVLFAMAIVGMAVIYLAFRLIISLFKQTPFQFSIRSLLLLTAAVAIPLSWLAAEIEWARMQKNAVAALIDQGGKVEYRDNFNFYCDPNLIAPRRKPAAPEWLEKMLGTDFFDTVDYVEFEGRTFTDADIAYIEDIRNLRLLRLWKTKVTDAEIDKLRKASPKLYIDVRTQ